jgi:sodium transport system permease protein
MNNFITVLKKELLDVSRDKKTLIFTILLPILIYPILFNIMSTTMKSSKEDANKEIRIVIEGDRSSELSKLIETQQNVKIIQNDQPTEALKKGDVQLIIQIPDGIDNLIKEQKEAKVEILVDDQSTKSTISASTINALITKYSEQIVQTRLQGLKVDSNLIKPLLVEQKSGINEANDSSGIGTMMIGMLPCLIIILLLTPTIGLSAELGAGEKEKLTFEPLLSTSSSRNSLLWGKVATVAIILCCTLVASMASLCLSFSNYVNEISEGEANISLNIEPKSIAIIVLFSIILILVISMMQIGISMYARGTKEANTYLSGILMPIMILAFVPMYLDIKSMSMIFYNIPFLNTVCVMKEIILGIYNIEHLLIVLVWNIVYVVISIFFVKHLFSKEEIIFRM